MGIELRQNNDLIERDARLNQVELFRDVFSDMAVDPNIVPLMLKERNGEDLDAEGMFRLRSHWLGILKYIEWVYLDLPEDRRWVDSQRTNYSTFESYRQAWGNEESYSVAAKNRFDPEFVDFFNREVIRSTIK